MLGSDPLIHREAWHWMNGWYRAAVDRALLPAWVARKRITAERVDLYRYMPTPGKNIPVYVEPFLIDGLVPTE